MDYIPLIAVALVALGGLAAVVVISVHYQRSAERLVTRALSSEKTFSPGKELQPHLESVMPETEFQAFEREQKRQAEWEAHLTGAKL